MRHTDAVRRFACRSVSILLKEAEIMLGVAATLVLSLSVHAVGQHAHDHGFGMNPGYAIAQPVTLDQGQALGLGFFGGKVDTYGWVDYTGRIALGPDRTPEYYFPRFLTVPPIQLFSAPYWNPYLTEGQRYIPYKVLDMNTWTPITPYENSLGTVPQRPVPAMTGKTDSKPVNINVSGSKR